MMLAKQKVPKSQTKDALQYFLRNSPIHVLGLFTAGMGMVQETLSLKFSVDLTRGTPRSGE